MTEEVIRHMARLRRVCSPSTWSPELSDLGRAQNAGPAESASLEHRDPEPERLTPGNACNPGTL